jgi:hypothetical protein
MAFKGEWGTFVHIPKCGGWGLRQYLREHFGNGIELAPYHGLPVAKIDNGFTLVRHPVTWLRSIWAYRNNSNWEVRYKKDGSIGHVNHWPVIMGLTQWAKRLSWADFVDALVEHQIDIVSIVYGMYRHHNVVVFKLEELDALYEHLGTNKPLPVEHVTPNKPKITQQQWEKLAYVCHRSMVDYGYGEIDSVNLLAQIHSLKRTLQPAT